MAVKHRQTVGNVQILEVDADPSDVISAPVSSFALDSTNVKWYRNVNGATQWIETDAFSTTNEPTGFTTKSDSTISFDDVGKIFTIAPTGPSFDVYVKGQRYTKTAPDTKDISGVIAEGLWYFYYDDTGTLQGDQVGWDFSQHAPVAIIHWDNTDGVEHNIIADERHGPGMDWGTHEYLHLTIGTRYSNGLTAGNFTLVGDGSVNAHAQLSVSNGRIFDEDLEVSIIDGAGAGDFEQELSPTAEIPVFFRYAAGGPWRKRDADTFPLIYDSAPGLPGAITYNPTGGADRIPWNDINAGGAGVWGFTEAGATNFVAVWLFATNNLNEPIVAVLGQREDLTLATARDNNNFGSLALGTFPILEAKVLYRLIFQTNGVYANTPHARLRDVLDLRSISNAPGGTFVPTDHNSLSGRSDDDSHTAPAISYDNTISGLVADDVKDAIDELAASGGLEYVLTWGAKMNGVGEYALVSGLATTPRIATLDRRTEHIVPKAGTMNAFTWNSRLADATTVWKIWQNGLVVETITATGANGVDSSLTTVVAAGDRLAIEYDAGTVPDESTFNLEIE
jgi:hypothetical protein